MSCNCEDCRFVAFSATDSANVCGICEDQDRFEQVTAQNGYDVPDGFGYEGTTFLPYEPEEMAYIEPPSQEELDEFEAEQALANKFIKEHNIDLSSTEYARIYKFLYPNYKDDDIPF